MKITKMTREEKVEFLIKELLKLSNQPMGRMMEPEEIIEMSDERLDKMLEIYVSHEEKAA